MQRLVLLNIVGLSESLLGERMPRFTEWAKRVGLQSFPPSFPAVTCTAQSDMLTGGDAGLHGIVANGWYDRESCEVRFWKQSNHLVRGEKIWDVLKRQIPGFTCANLFWWYNMATRADIAVTPRPLYLSDGAKHFDIHTQPMGLRDALKEALGNFPFPSFWGPRAGIACSEWIANCARWIEEQHSPHLNLVYLPHLDYGLQKHGPDSALMAEELRSIDDVACDLIEFYEKRGVRVLVVSEYGISAVHTPIHLNRLLRANGWLSIKDELGRDGLDFFQSDAIAVADHQVAHVYVKDPARIGELKELLAKQVGIESVKEVKEVWPEGVAHERAGDLLITAAEGYWFTYYFWKDDQRAPDYARCVDIHRKPGYDPAELFVDPEIGCPQLKVAWFLLKKKIGMKALMEVIPLDASLVKGSHGRGEVLPQERPIIAGANGKIGSAKEVFAEIWQHFGILP